jgi:hypothetical protein
MLVSGVEDNSEEPRGSGGGSPILVAWVEFALWAVLGAIAGFGLVAFGALVAVPILIAVLLALTRPAFRRSWFGAMTGLGVMSLLIAFGERHGPGTVCWQSATAAGCDQYLNPWPWAVVGIVLVVAGLVAQARLVRALY